MSSVIIGGFEYPLGEMPDYLYRQHGDNLESAIVDLAEPLVVSINRQLCKNSTRPEIIRQKLKQDGYVCIRPEEQPELSEPTKRDVRQYPVDSCLEVPRDILLDLRKLHAMVEKIQPGFQHDVGQTLADFNSAKGGLKKLKIMNGFIIDAIQHLEAV